MAEAEIARRTGEVTALHDPTEGGFASAVRELAIVSGAGVEIDAEAIPILDETRAVAEALEIDPLGMLASGSLLIATRAGGRAGDPARHRICRNSGQRRRQADRGSRRSVAHYGREKRPLPEFAVDEVARVLSGSGITQSSPLLHVHESSCSSAVSMRMSGSATGWMVLQSGGSAIDAVVAAIRKVEANPDDHSVGFGGLPNLEGEVELDASIMDGRTLATGAVAALHGYQDAIALARVVMDELPHVLVVGSGASRLAGEAGFQPQDLLTPEARVIWESPFTEAGTADAYREKMRELAGRLSRDPERPHDTHGTVNVIARDAAGNLASGVSTSGVGLEVSRTGR